MSMALSIDDPKFAVRIRARDPEALQAVVQAYLGQILRAARGAGLDASRAADVTQATFATFIEKAQEFEGRSQSIVSQKSGLNREAGSQQLNSISTTGPPAPGESTRAR